ncbi:MAG TPA: hypothetical protein VF172_07885 [Nitrososphaera sp.]
MAGGDSLAKPVAAGLAVGIAFVVTFSLFAAYALPRNSVFVEPPPMLLQINESDMRYEGGIGSYCGRDFCADSALALVVPDEVVAIQSGSEIAFEVVGYGQPDELDIYILDSQYGQTDLRLERTAASSYIMDVPPDVYILSVHTAWLEPSRHDAVYHYRVNVTAVPVPSGLGSLLSREDAIRVALNETHGAESRGQADITSTLYYLDENGDAFEVDVDTLEKTPVDNAPLYSLARDMFYWHITLRFGSMDMHWVTVNASNGNIETHVAT